jgi:NAD(P)-dependent dehydrogenase (short-subunit alcohol dehydrogenase family)
MFQGAQSMEKWNTSCIEPLTRKTAIVTGGTDGIGLEVARELARNGAEVIICADDVQKGEKALLDLRKSLQGAQISFERLDLADLESVSEFCRRIKMDHEHLHILVNNGGLAAVPEHLESKQGYELMFAVNYLSHFAITAQLFSLLEATPGSRVIFQSGLEHHQGVIDFYDLNATHLYDSKKSYAQSKLAMLLFAKELDRRICETHLQIKSISVHPGGSRTNIFSKGPSLSKKMIRPYDLMKMFLVYSFGQSAAMGALPTLFAATSPDAISGHFYGPDGFQEMRGYPTEVEPAIQGKNMQAAEKLWEVSEALTGIEFKLADFSNVLPFQMRGNILPEGWPPGI